MTNFSWKAPDLNIINQISDLLKNSTESGCDISPVNLFLYSHKYNTKVLVNKGWLFRKYEEAGFIYYGFPVCLEKTNFTLAEALSFIQKDAEAQGFKAMLFFATDRQIEKLNTAQLPFSVKFSKNRNLTDYLYLTEKLSTLTGSKLQKKRNHINQFKKKHPNHSYISLTKENLSLAMEVEEKWFGAYCQKYGAEESKELQVEKKLIELALANYEELELSGGLVLVEQKPVAFCLGSKINSETTDIHFEKALDPYAKDGAYAFINQSFASTLSTKYINREEDLGLENLRKAKESYFPDLLLEKSIITLG